MIKVGDTVYRLHSDIGVFKTNVVTKVGKKYFYTDKTCGKISLFDFEMITWPYHSFFLSEQHYKDNLLQIELIQRVRKLPKLPLEKLKRIVAIIEEK